MELSDVRRLTGVNFFMDSCGAAGDAVISDDGKEFVVALWRRQMRQLLDAVGWSEEKILVRGYPSGASLVITAPVDALYVATDMIEHVWGTALRTLEDASTPDLSAAARNFTDRITADSNPALTALTNAAQQRGVTFLGDDGTVSLGLGTGCQTWEETALPAPVDVDWARLHDIPVAMVTGTNGKSTTVRLTAAICRAAGCTVGLSSSDWVRVGSEIIDEGDYSGPAGARLAVRDKRVDIAVIETARGGLMRRGLPIPSADACLITNVAADHLGDYGITDINSLAQAKFLLARAVKPDGRLVLNGDDLELVNRGLGFAGPITWYGLTLDRNALGRWLDQGGHAAFVEDGVMTLGKDGARFPILAVTDFPLGLSGAAKYNISNALGAIALSSALGADAEAMTAALSGFEATPQENPGRGNFMDIGGVKILVDFAHNPHGVAALLDAISEVPAERKLVLLGQAGDRGDSDIQEMARLVWAARPDMIIVKELETKLRGRELGDIPAIIIAELKRLGATDDDFLTADTEMESVYKALDWARAGDFLVLLLHIDRKRAQALLDDLADRNWQAGDPVKR